MLQQHGQTEPFSLGLVFHEVLTGQLLELDQALLIGNDASARAEFQSRFADGFGDQVPELIARMLGEASETRPSAQRIVEILKGQTLFFSVSTIEKFSPIHVGTFIWHPSVHANLGCRRLLLFLHSHRPAAELKFIEANLKERHVSSFAIYRVLGGHDFVLECWVDEKHHRHVREVIALHETNHRVNQSEEYIAIDSRPIKKAKGEWASLQAEKLVKYIADALDEIPDDVDSSEMAEYQEYVLSDKGLVIGRVSGPSDEIKLMLKVSADRDLDENELNYYFTTLNDFVSNRQDDPANGFRVAVSKMSDKRTILIECALTRFHDYSGLLFALIEDLNARALRNARVDFTFRTCVVMDARGIYEAHDGLVVERIGQEFRFRERG